MAQFHETRTGTRFFESQLPTLVEALVSIAKSLATLAAKEKPRQGDRW